MKSARLQKRIAAVPACARCEPNGGLFVPGARGGLGRCNCLRGRLLFKADQRLMGLLDSGASHAQRSVPAL